MKATEDNEESDLQIALDRSSDLIAAIAAAWDDAIETAEPAKEATLRLCHLSIGHGLAVRLLLPFVPASAIALIRLQYECLVRSAWAAYSATEAELDRLIVPLTVDSQQAAKKLPGVPEMLAALEKSGPRGASAVLARARTQMGDGLNSFVHGGIHPFARQETGYPIALLVQLLKSSNGLSMLTLPLLATLVRDPGATAESISVLNSSFGDVLPELQPFDQ